MNLLILLGITLLNAAEINFKTKNIFNSQSGEMDRVNNISVSESGFISRKNSDKISFHYDLSNYYVLPGLIDSHTHLFILDKSFGDNFSDEITKIYNTDSNIRFVNAQKNGQSLVESGITSVRDLGNSGNYLDEKMAGDIAIEPVVFPRIYYSGPGIASAKAQFKLNADNVIVETEYDILNTPQDIPKLVSEHKHHKVNFIKIYADNDPGKDSLSKDLLCQVVNAAHAAGFKVAAHAMYPQSIDKAIECNVDSIEHAYFLNNSQLKKMAQKNIFMVPTDTQVNLYQKFNMMIRATKPKSSRWKTKAYQKAISDRLKEAYKLGVPLAFGSDMYIDVSSLNMSQGQAAKESLYSYVDNGLSPKIALMMATSGGAKLLNDQLLGEIKAGAYADFIAVRKNPLKNIRALDEIVLVVSRGKIVFSKLNSPGKSK